jgi:hypothetical protein
MMNHVVLGEGRNEVYFMQKILERCNPDPGVRKVIAEDIPGQSLTDGDEEDVIRDFRRDHDKEYLVKSEGGYPNLYSIFAYSCEKVLYGLITATLVADLDNRSISDFVSDVQDELVEEYRGSVEWVGRHHRQTVGDLRTWEVTVEDGDYDEQSSINLVTFDNDLEAAVGCLSSDPPKQRQQAIRKYAARTPVRRAFIDLYD